MRRILTHAQLHAVYYKIHFFIQVISFSFIATILFASPASAQQSKTWRVSPDTAAEIINFFNNTDLTSCQVSNIYLSYVFEEVHMQFLAHEQLGCITQLTSIAELGEPKKQNCTIEEIQAVAWASLEEDQFFGPNPNCQTLKPELEHEFSVTAASISEIHNFFTTHDLNNCEIKKITLNYAQGTSVLEFVSQLNSSQDSNCLVGLSHQLSSPKSLSTNPPYEYCDPSEILVDTLTRNANAKLRTAPIDTFICKDPYQRFNYYVTSNKAEQINNIIISGMALVANLADVKVFYPNGEVLKYRSTYNDAHWHYHIQNTLPGNKTEIIECTLKDIQDINWVYTDTGAVRHNKPKFNSDCTEQFEAPGTAFISWLNYLLNNWFAWWR